MVGVVFLILAALLFLVTALGAVFVPGQLALGFFLFVMGILLNGVGPPWPKQ